MPNEFKDHRKSILCQISEIGKDGAKVEISQQELIHLLHMRSVGFGTIEVTIAHGKPSMCKRIEERLDYTKPLEINAE
jgi:hypothetical protein